MRDSLEDMGYPREGILYVDAGGGDGYEMPQEALSARDCGSCRLFDSKEWTCKRTGKDKDPDIDYCDGIDYDEQWLDCEYGFREPVRHEYSSDENYEKACEVIRSLNRAIKREHEEE